MLEDSIEAYGTAAKLSPSDAVPFLLLSVALEQKAHRILGGAEDTEEVEASRRACARSWRTKPRRPREANETTAEANATTVNEVEVAIELAAEEPCDSEPWAASTPWPVAGLPDDTGFDRPPPPPAASATDVRMATSYLKMGRSFWFAKAQFDKARRRVQEGAQTRALPAVRPPQNDAAMAESRRQFNESLTHALTALRLTPLADQASRRRRSSAGRRRGGAAGVDASPATAAATPDAVASDAVASPDANASEEHRVAAADAGAAEATENATGDRRTARRIRAVQSRRPTRPRRRPTRPRRRPARTAPAANATAPAAFATATFNITQAIADAVGRTARSFCGSVALADQRPPRARRAPRVPGPPDDSDRAASGQLDERDRGCFG